MSVLLVVTAGTDEMARPALGKRRRAWVMPLSVLSVMPWNMPK
jgi:hypothetical protein